MLQAKIKGLTYQFFWRFLIMLTALSLMHIHKTK